MIIKQKFLYNICFLLILFSCQKVIDIEVDRPEPKPVVNCLITEGDSITLHLSRSAYIKEKEVEVIDGADVLIFEDNILLDTLRSLGEGYFSSNMVSPRPGSLYRVEVYAQGFAPVCAEDRMPSSKVRIDSATYIKDAGMYIEGDHTDEYRIQFSDPEYEDNFYEIKISKNFSAQDNLDYIIISSNDPVIVSENLTDGFSETLLFTDKLINGKRYEVKTFSLEAYFNEDQPGVIIIGPSSVSIVLCAVSENYYNYKKRLEQHLENQEGDLINGNNNPIDMYTNVENGYGIFACYYTDTLIIDLEDEK